MSRCLVVCVLVLSALVAAPAGAAPASRLQVVAKEFTYSLSRPKLKAGPVIIELVNFGEDSHDLRLRRIGGTRTYGVGPVLPGRHADLRVRLQPGRYRLWCSIANHRALGMRATLVVRK